MTDLAYLLAVIRRQRPRDYADGILGCTVVAAFLCLCLAGG